MTLVDTFTCPDNQERVFPGKTKGACVALVAALVSLVLALVAIVVALFAALVLVSLVLALVNTQKRIYLHTNTHKYTRTHINTQRRI